MCRSTSQNGKIRLLAWPARANVRLNPYNHLLSEALEMTGSVEVVEFSPVDALLGKYDVWHMHWPESMLSSQSRLRSFVRLAVLVILILVRRLRGTRLILTVHNRGQHEQMHPMLENVLDRVLAMAIDGYIVMGRTSLDENLSRGKVGRKPTHLVPHGLYTGFYPNDMSAQEARKRLAIPDEAFVFLFLGSIRAYKNVDRLVREFRRLSSPTAALLIAGKPHTPDLEAQIRVMSECDPRIRLHLEFVPDEDIQMFMNAANIVVLPYRDVLNSGSAYLALSFQKPVLAPAVGSLVELAEQLPPGWINLYSDDLDAIVLEQFLSSVFDSPQRPEEVLPTWTEIGQKTVAAYRDVVCQR